MTVTLRLLDDDRRMPEVNRADVLVREDKDRMQVTGWTPARGDHAGLDVFILIDDASSTSLGSQLDDLRAIYQGPAANHFSVSAVHPEWDGSNHPELHNRTQSSRESSAASRGANGSPYLSLIDLIIARQRFSRTSPRHNNRAKHSHLPVRIQVARSES
jgi:hypothetical protein